MTDVASPGPAIMPEHHGLTRRVGAGLAALARFLLASLLCLTPVTAILVLGWLQRRMRCQVSRAYAIESVVGGPPHLMMAEPGTSSGLFGMASGGFSRNLICGLRGLAAALLITLPFSSLWLLGWWAGWENSFNKGYEQAWVGPLLGLTGLTLCVLVLPLLPYALAHVAIEERLLAVLELGRIRAIAANSGWRVLAVTAILLLAAGLTLGARMLPMVAAKGAEQFATDAVALARLRYSMAFGASVGLAAVLLLLGRVVASAYATGRIRIDAKSAGPDRITALLFFLLTRVLAAGFVILIFVAQFFNHSWSLWVLNPVLVLPWLGL